MFLFRLFLILSLSFWPFGGAREEGEIKKTSLELPAHLEDFKLIRILLAQNVSEVTLESPSPYRITNEQGHTLLSGEKILSTRLRADVSGGIQIGPQVFGEPAIRIESQGEGIQVGESLYREALEIRREKDSRLSIVNELDLEEYLKGVLPLEVNAKWSQEALKAQAVASRTYALFKAIEHQKESFVLSKDVLSQVYGGKNSEKVSTTEAVEATGGEILVWRGEIFPAYFHSTCGGATTHAEYAWNVERHPVLEGVTCTFCRGSQHYRWEAAFKAEEIEKKLRRRGMVVSSIERIRPKDLDATGRARKIEIEYEGDKTQVHSNDFRLWLDPARLRSTLLVSVMREGDIFYFKGRGWGHGVGLCQFGMKQLSDLGYTYRQILEYYYPGAEIVSTAEESSI